MPGLIVSCNNTPKTTTERYYPPKKAQQKSNTPQKKEQLWGHWVCSDFVELVKARKSVRNITNKPVFLEIVFSPSFGDSALLITGYNKILMPYTKKGSDSIIIKNTRTGTNTVLYTKSNLSSIEIKDHLVGDKSGTSHTWTFTKTSGIKKNKTTDLQQHINTGVLAGTYASGSNTEVEFTKKGSVTGWEGYTNYNICTGGDCFMLTNASLDIVTLKNSGKKEHFAFWRKSNDSLYFYKLEKINDDHFYNHQPENVVLALKKIK